MGRAFCKLKNKIPEAVYMKVTNMDPIGQAGFVDEFNRQRKSKGVGYALLFFSGVLGLHYLYFKKTSLFFIFLFTFGGVGIWWLIDLFRVPSIVATYNKSVAISVLRDVQILS